MIANALKFENLSIAVLEHCYQTDRYSVDNLLFLPTQYYSTKASPNTNAINSSSQGRKWSFTSDSVVESVTAFHVADVTHNDQFMSHSATHEVLNDRWYGDLSSESSLLCVFFVVKRH